MTTGNNILKDIISIAKGNKFLKYLVVRLQLEGYRGWHVSQHNRYSINDIHEILDAIYDTKGDNYFLIPPGDYNKSAKLLNGLKCYGEIVQKINKRLGKGTINSIKKNFFPDLEGMGFLYRPWRTMKNSSGRSVRVRYGKITDSGIRFIKEKKLVNKYKIYTDGIDKLFDGKISLLADTINLSDYANASIEIHEFMFILSDKYLTPINKIKLLDSYRKLSRRKQTRLVNLVQKYANPDRFTGNKTAKRDFHNWKNQAQQIMNLLGQTVYFLVDSNKHMKLNTDNTKGFFQTPTRRSITPKIKYFRVHNINKKDKFELHHIVPIADARNKNEAKMIDDFRNLIYLHRDTHSDINRSNVKLCIDASVAKFSDLHEVNQEIIAYNNKEALYSKDTTKISRMSSYNKKLLRKIYD